MSFEQKQYWLKGVEYERERITKLLEKEQQELVIDQNHNGAAVLRDVVALIKGEEQ